MIWQIRNNDGSIKASIKKLEYNDEWMSQRYVSTSIESPSPIDFQIGDYLIYRGERFEINYDPGKIKSAPRYEKGDAFKYENVKFNSLDDELARCDFLDVVLEDNQLHFTGLPKFSFYGGVTDVADRIQANLDRAYGKRTWKISVSKEYTSDTELNVTADTIKVSGALGIIVNDFKTYYTIEGRNIVIGASGIPADHLFTYGKGNGLYEIEQNAEADQAIVTRLRAYGSTRNMPHRYYNSLSGADGKVFIPDNMAVQYLMLPDFPDKTQDPYIDSQNIDTLGIREGTIFFDGSGDFEEIYPSIEGMSVEDLKAAGVTCNSTGELDVLVDSQKMTDNGVGKIAGDAFEGNVTTTAEPATFKVTIKDIGFDINDHLTTDTATISFKSGMLGGRDFEIVGCVAKKSGNNVVGYELELNRVYDDDIKLWFPYLNYNAKAGDKFVLLNIKMPVVYIKAASQKLKSKAQEWLDKNDYSRSVYNPKIDELFMARQHDMAITSGGTIKSLHDTLRAGMQLLFEDNDLDINAAIFIDRLTITEGDGLIPKYSVTLKEEKTVGTIQKMQNKIDSLIAGQGQGSGGYTASQIRALIDAYGGTRFLSKLKADRTPYLLSSDRGFEVGDYMSGVSGGMLGIDPDGDSFAEVGRLWVRVKAFFEELTIVKSNVLAGKQYITPGGGIKCTKVEETASGYRCYFLSQQDGEKTYTKFIVNDQAICEEFNAGSGTSAKVSNHRYWRLVTAVNNDAYTDDSGNHYGYIDLSKSVCESGSDIPVVGDEICQFGYRGSDNKERQSAMVFSTVDADSPCVKLFSGIDSFSLSDKAVISFGRDAVSGQIYFRLGNSTATQYLNYTQNGGLEVAGSISTVSTYNGKPLDDYISDAAKSAADTAQNTMQSKIDDLQKQIDGVVEAWSFPYAPTLTNEPAKNWKTDAEKLTHVGDVFYDIEPYVDDKTTPDAGKAWRWSQNDADNGGYHWHPIADSDAVRALELAQMSVTTADVLYKQSNSNTTAPVLPTADSSGNITNYNGWQTTAPTWKANEYIWQTTYIKKGDGNASFSFPTCISGREGTDGKGIVSITEQYYLSTSRDQLSGGSWSDSRPTWVAGRFYWTRSKITYTDSSVVYTSGICVTGDTGASGTSVLAEYSEDGTSWHSSYQSGDVWMHTSSDGGKTWSAAIMIAGVDFQPNLLKGTKDGFLVNETIPTGQWGQVTQVPFDDGIELAVGDDIAVNIESITQIAGSTSSYSIVLYDVSPNKGLIKPLTDNLTITAENPQCVFRVLRTKADGNSIALLLYPGLNGSLAGCQARYGRVMAVRGTVPMAWSPAASELVGADGKNGADGKWRKYQWAKNNTTATEPTSGWQDTPLTASVGEYVWMRSGWVVPPATDPASYEKATRITGDKGEQGIPGTSPVMLDLTDEVKGIACDTSGNPIATIPSSQATVWLGSTIVNNTDVKYSVIPSGVNANIDNTGKVTFDTLTSENATVKVIAEINNQKLESSISIYKIIPGKQGIQGTQGYGTVSTISRTTFTEANWATYGTIGHVENWSNTENSRNGCRIGDFFRIYGTATDSGKSHVLIYKSDTDSGTLHGSCVAHEIAEAGDAAVVYSIEPSVDNITKSMAKTLSKTSVTCSVYKTTGNSQRALTSDKTLTCYKAKSDGTTETTILTHSNGVSSAVSVNADVESLIFELTDGTTLLDRERVPVLSDASDLEVGARNLLLDSKEFTVGVGSTSNYAYLSFKLPIALKKGDYVAFSVESITNVLGSPDSYSVGVWDIFLMNNISGGTKALTASQKTAVLQITADEAEPKFLIYAGKTGATAGNSVKYTKAMLVKGNVPMQTWEAAPEDLIIGGRNLILNSSQYIRTSNYLMKSYKLASKPTVGKTYTLTLWGALASTKSFFAIFNSGGDVQLANLTKVDNGVYQATFKWRNSLNGNTASDTNINVYAAESSQSGTSEISLIQLEEGSMGTSWNEAPEDIKALISKNDYISNALEDGTNINGGLILSSMISLGCNNSDYASQTVWSGMNGRYYDGAVGGGIAAWYGGDTYDLAEFYNWNSSSMSWEAKQSNLPERIAKGVDRMDGSGYRAGGNFFWDAEGNATFVGSIFARGVLTGELVVGEQGGQRIELDPAQKVLNVFNDKGSIVATHSGRTISIDEAQPSDTKGVSGKTVISFTSTYLKVTSGSSASGTQNKTICSGNATNSGVLTIDIPSFNLFAYSQSASSGTAINPLISLDLYLDITLGADSMRYYLGSATSMKAGSESQTEPKKFNIPIPKNTSYIANITAEYSLKGSQGSEGNIEISSRTIPYDLTTQAYRCEYGANGWVISNDSKNYAYLIFEKDILHFKVVSDGKTVIES